MSAGVASAYFLAKTALDAAEDRVSRLLDEVIGAGCWQDFTADYYDDSIEVFGVSPELVLSETQQAALWYAGFRRCWTHTLLERADNEPDEQYYYDRRPGGAAPDGRGGK